jgi:hypothetical protein
MDTSNGGGSLRRTGILSRGVVLLVAKLAWAKSPTDLKQMHWHIKSFAHMHVWLLMLPFWSYPGTSLAIVAFILQLPFDFMQLSMRILYPPLLKGRQATTP